MEILKLPVGIDNFKKYAVIIFIILTKQSLSNRLYIIGVK